MATISENITQIKQEIGKVQLCVVSKYRSLAQLKEVYDCGHRVFGENRVQEMVEKQALLPEDIEWHAIGHLQTNKVKFIAPFVALIHSVDSLKLLKTINKEAAKNNRTIDFLFQLHIAKEESKFGLDEDGLSAILQSEEYKSCAHVRCRGLMGMATNTEDEKQILTEFNSLKSLFDKHKEDQWSLLSMGMSGDYQLAIDAGSNLIRVGSKVFN